MEWLLILIVAACIIALVVISKKRRELEDVIPSPEKKPDEVINQEHTVDLIIVGPPQHTIYEYNAKSAKCNCTLCDAENESSSEICIVCGEKLIKKGV